MTQDVNKIYQTIYTDESGTNSKEIEWTIEELKNQVRNANSINNYYQTNPGAVDFIAAKKTKKLKDGDREEKWRKCKSSDEICKRNGIDEKENEIHASDFGRIKLHNIKGENTIFPLYDSVNLDKPICGDVFIKLCENQEELRKIGYLIAKIPEILGTDNFLVDCNGHNLNVYRLVADAWLENYKCYECYKSNSLIHHITDDGYDNSPENLIALDTETHNQIPTKCGKEDKHYHPRRIKTLKFEQ